MTTQHAAERLRAARLALAAGVSTAALKGIAWWGTGSVAVLSDALESLVNVVAAIFLLLALGIALRPPDRNHPYGHGKVEYFSAGVEGALIVFAALAIAVESVAAWQRGTPPARIDLGLALVFGASVLNAVLGVHLVRVGRRVSSLALEADGRHLLSDVATSVGVVAGLVAVRVTGWVWVDAAVALGVAVHILWVGGGLVRRAVGGLMDEADPALLGAASAGLEHARTPSWVDVHSLRLARAGPSVYGDLHLVVPRFFDAEHLHDVGEAVEDALLDAVDAPGEVIVHFDPCRPRDCGRCALLDCPVRSAGPGAPLPIDSERATRMGDDGDDSG